MNGGGGGSRTRVRKYSTWASTCLSRTLVVGLRDPFGPGSLSLILIKVSRVSHQAVAVAIPLVDAQTGFAGVTRQDGSLSRYGVVIIVCDYIFGSHRFTSGQESSTCSQCFIIPVEAVSPPNFERSFEPIIGAAGGIVKAFQAAWRGVGGFDPGHIYPAFNTPYSLCRTPQLC